MYVNMENTGMHKRITKKRRWMLPHFSGKLMKSLGEFMGIMNK